MHLRDIIPIFFVCSCIASSTANAAGSRPAGEGLGSLLITPRQIDAQSPTAAAAEDGRLSRAAIPHRRPWDQPPAQSSPGQSMPGGGALGQGMVETFAGVLLLVLATSFVLLSGKRNRP